MQDPPAKSGIELANWNWKVVRQYVAEQYGARLSRSSCLNWLHRLGFAFKRPKKRLVKADGAKREAFVAEYAVLSEEMSWTGSKIFFADEAHFRADAELRGKWVLRGEPALVDSTSPRYGEKASYYSAVCLETGEVEWMELEGNSNSETSTAFLTQLRERHTGPLNVIWDNAPAHRGEAVREYLRTPGLALRLVNPRFHEGRLCRDTARTSTLTRPSGAGRERRRPGTCAWGPSHGCKRGSRTSSPGWPTGNRRSNAAAAPSCNQGLKSCCGTHNPIPNPRQMHISPWLWFSTTVADWTGGVCSGTAGPGLGGAVSITTRTG